MAQLNWPASIGWYMVPNSGLGLSPFGWSICKEEGNCIILLGPTTQENVTQLRESQKSTVAPFSAVFCGKPMC